MDKKPFRIEVARNGFHFRWLFQFFGAMLGGYHQHSMIYLFQRKEKKAPQNPECLATEGFVRLSTFELIRIVYHEVW